MPAYCPADSAVGKIFDGCWIISFTIRENNHCFNVTTWEVSARYVKVSVAGRRLYIMLKRMSFTDISQNNWRRHTPSSSSFIFKRLTLL